MKRWLLAMAAVFGCGSPAQEEGIVHDACAPLLLVPADDTQPAEREGVLAALGMWHVLGVTGPRIEAAREVEELPVIFDLAPSAFRGVYEPGSGSLFVNRRLTDPFERSVTVAHELGHAIGLPHVDESVRASVMNPGNLAVRPTREDAEALALLWGECLDVP